MKRCKKIGSNKWLKHSWLLEGRWQVCAHCDLQIPVTKKFLQEVERCDKKSKNIKFRR